MIKLTNNSGLFLWKKEFPNLSYYLAKAIDKEK